MIKKIVLWFIGILVLAAAAGTGYYYYYYPLAFPNVQDLPVVGTPQARPDVTIVAGTVTSITANSMTLKKPDGSERVVGIATTTAILLSSQSGAAPSLATISTITVGTTVLVNLDSSDHSIAQTILIVPPPAR